MFPSLTLRTSDLLSGLGGHGVEAAINTRSTYLAVALNGPTSFRWVSYQWHHVSIKTGQAELVLFFFFFTMAVVSCATRRLSLRWRTATRRVRVITLTVRIERCKHNLYWQRKHNPLTLDLCPRLPRGEEGRAVMGGWGRLELAWSSTHIS